MFGNRGGEALVTIVDAEHWTELATWTARPADGHDWRIYAGAVSEDETRLYLSYHGPDTTGIDRFEVAADSLQCCPASQWANAGCISGHGGFALVGDRLLAATGLPVIVEVNAAGSITASYDARLEWPAHVGADGSLQRGDAVDEARLLGRARVTRHRDWRRRPDRGWRVGLDLRAMVAGHRVAVVGVLRGMASMCRRRTLRHVNSSAPRGRSGG